MPRQVRRRYRVALVVATLAALTACSDSVAPARPHPNLPIYPQGAPSSSRDGSWAGITEEGYPVRFTIEGSLIRDLFITLKLAGDCDIVVDQAHVNATADAFATPFQLGDGSDNKLAVVGQFSDDGATVAGSATLNYVSTLPDGTACNSTGATTWTASRNY